MSTRWALATPQRDTHDEVARSPIPGVGSSVHVFHRRPMTSPPILVGGCGGAGATTTALGLAAAAAGDIDCPTVAVDATDAGRDLATRGADVHLTPTPLQPWLAAALSPQTRHAYAQLLEGIGA